MLAGLLAYLDAHPEVWGVLGGLLAAAFGGRYAWVRRAVLAAVQAAADQHPDDPHAQIAYVGKHRRRAVARKAAKIIRARMYADRPTPLPGAVASAPLDPLEFELDVHTPTELDVHTPTEPDAVPTLPDAGRPPSSRPPGRIKS